MPRRLFRKGESGNPAGRPKGSKNKVRFDPHEILGPLLDDAIGVIADAVRAGDIAAAKLVLDKLIANPKPADRGSVSLPELATARLEDIPTLLVRAVGEGRLGLDEAAQLAALVTAHARVIDQLLIEPDLRARAAKTGQLAVLDPQRGYFTRPFAEEEAA
jgi:hypothetical protein